MHRVLALTLLAACYSPTPPAGAPCSSLGTCPDGLQCIAQKCEVRGGDPPPPPDSGMEPDAAVDADGDGDGVVDTADNCRGTANANQADEDSDLIGDECDGCPQIGDPAPVDGDGDGIADGCDPNPGVADSRWKFEGFQSGLLPEWGKSLGWMAMIGALRAAAGGGQQDLGEYLTVPIAQTGRTFDKFSLAVTGQIVQTVGSDSVFGMSVYDTGLRRTVYCHLQLLGSARAISIEEWDDNATQPRQRRAEPYAWRNTATYRITIARQARNYSCTVVGPEGTKMVTAASDVVPRQEPDIGAFGATVQVDSVLAVGSP